MSLGFRIRSIMAGSAVLLGAGGALMLAAPGASAADASGLSLSVNITSQTTGGSPIPNWGVTFSMTITNSTGASVTLTSVGAPNYTPLDNAPGAGTVLPTGASTFTGLVSFGGGPGVLPGQPEAPPPLVLTVVTSAGSATWNQSVSDPQVVTNIEEGGSDFVGSFDAANCSQYYFQYGATTAYGQQAGTSSVNCPNDGTATEQTRTPLPTLQSGSYHYRLVVIQSDGTALYGQDQPFTVSGTTVPVGSVGTIGLAALAGCGLFLTQRWRRRRR